VKKRTSLFNRFVSILFILAFLLTALPNRNTTAAGPWYVKEGGNDGSDCLSPATACETINGAIGKASSGDVINVARGTYTGSGTEVVNIDSNKFLSGGWNTNFNDNNGLSTINGENARRGVVVGGSTNSVIISRFIIENGSSDGAAGISASGVLTLYRCIVRNNTDTGDWTSEGGGIRTVSNLIINHSTIHDNTSSSGAGLFNAFGTMIIKNSTISGNIASGGGGGINNLGGIIYTYNVTISNNTDTTAGGGIHNEAGGTVTLENTILAGNSSNWANDCGGTIGTSGYNLIGDTSFCGFTPTTGDIYDIDPRLDPLANNGGLTPTHALLSTSPAIDSGNDATCFSTDQRDYSRPVDGDQDSTATCDMGAFEYVPPTFPDVPWTHWAVNFVEAIYNAGLTSGYPDGTYRPENPVTRAEMAVFLLNGMGITPSTPDGSHPFSDIGGHWAAAYIEELYDQGVTGGYPDGTYRPDNLVTRAEMAVFLLNSLGHSPDPINGSHPFSDIAGHWAEAFIEELYDRGITGGYPDGTYRPGNQVTRAEMAVFLVNAFNIP